MVNNSRIAWTEFDPADVPHAIRWNGDDKIPEHVGSTGRNNVRLAQRDDQIWLAQLPPAGELPPWFG